MKYLIVCISVFALNINLQGQYLPPALQGKTVNMKLVHSSKYLSGHDAVPAGNNLYQLYELPDFFSQEFELQLVAGQPNWYYIYHVASGRYVTYSGENAQVLLQPKQTPEPVAVALQTFQFVAQTEPGRFKIHSRASSGGFAYVLEISESDNNDGARLYARHNKTIGNSEHQKFDLTDLNPPADPGSAIPSLANRFEGRTCGFINRSFVQPLIGNGTTEDVTMTPLAGFPAFDQQFKIEYTSETGWFKIKHKASGKYATVMSPIVDGGVVKLKTDAAYPDDQQKFKFIIQGNDSTYKIHSRYSVGTPGFEKALVLEMVFGNTNSPLRLKKNITIGSDQWQQFIIFKYSAPPAEFTTGSATAGSGKILGKQYYMSNFESLAMLEPYVVGSDTFVRLQNSPAYGEQSEWTFDEGGTTSGFTYIRIRYGKTGQYLYTPVTTENTLPNAGTKLRLRTDLGNAEDKRYKFRFNGDGNLEHTFSFVAGVGFEGNPDKEIIIDDDGNLVTSSAPPTSYINNRKFIINLSVPTDDSKLYALVTKNQGHLLSDSGKRGSLIPVVHQQYADYSCDWLFVSVGNQYFIRNNLTGQFLTNNYNTSNGASVYTTSFTGDNSTKWEVIREGNYYKIKNVHSGRYLALFNQPATGQPVYLGISTEAGSLWILTRSDYFPDVLPSPVSGVTLLNNFSPLTQNALNNLAYRDKMVRNIGLPFEPTYMTFANNPFANTNLQNNGFSITNRPDFYSVLRSALINKFSYSGAQVDSALANYKLDIAGHRVQMAYALRSYILENLALRSRSTWTYNEQELVGWIERKIRALKTSYADRLQESWGDFKTLLLLNGDDLPFSLLVSGGGLDYEAWREPEYYIPTDPQALSLAEYITICDDRNYNNPGELSALTVPSMVLGGATITASMVFSNTVVNAANASMQVTNEVIQRQIITYGKALKTAMQFQRSATTSARFLGKLTSIGATSFVISVIVMATEILVMKVIDGVKFDNYEQALNVKIARLRNVPIDVTTTMQTRNLLNQFYLCQDFDFVLGGGERFDNVYPSRPMFVGNGNWNNTANWSNSQVPTNPISAGYEVIINPVENGECNINIPVDVTNGGKITVNPGKRLKVSAQLSVPALQVNQ